MSGHCRLKLQQHVHILGNRHTSAQRIDLADCCQKLQNKILKFHHQGSAFIAPDSGTYVDDDMQSIDNCIFRFSDGWELDGSDAEEEEDSENDDSLGDEWSEEDGNLPEVTRIMLPSTLTKESRLKLNLTQLALQEVELRAGQANDLLEALHNALGEKSLISGPRCAMQKVKEQRTSPGMRFTELIER